MAALPPPELVRFSSGLVIKTTNVVEFAPALSSPTTVNEALVQLLPVRIFGPEGVQLAIVPPLKGSMVPKFKEVS